MTTRLPPSPAEIRAALLSQLPRLLIERTIRCVFGSWQEADLITAEFPIAMRRYLLPHARRAVLETNWRSIGASMDGVRAEFKANKIGNSYYAKLTVGGLVLTESHVDAPNRIPRMSEFRQHL